MRHRATFLAGLAVGLVAGARAGRERYDQLKKYTQKVIDSPSVRKATKTATQKAGELTKAASHQAADKLPKITETAKHSAEKVRSQLGRNHADGYDAEHATVNGTRPSS
jgi:hypothetical protein